MTETATPMWTHAHPGRLAALAVAVLAGLCTVALPTAPALAAPDPAKARVAFSPATADPGYATRLSLRGSGFQPIKGGFGGVYVMFGWVDSQWRPSQGGVSGKDYVYVQDTETKENHGYQRFVSFEGGSTEYAANGGTIHPDGTWATDLVVPGATFPARGRSGGTEQINCQRVQCGIITIGAHGVVNTQNETFTPIIFAVPGKQRQAPKTAAARKSNAPAAAAVPSIGTPPPTAVPSAGAAPGGLVINPAASPSSPSSGPVLPENAADTNAIPVTGGWLAGLATVVLLAGTAAGVVRYRRRGRSGTGAAA